MRKRKMRKADVRQNDTHVPAQQEKKTKKEIIQKKTFIDHAHLRSTLPDALPADG